MDAVQNPNGTLNSWRTADEENLLSLIDIAASGEWKQWAKQVPSLG